METKRGSQPAFATNDFVPQWMKKEEGKMGAGSKGFEHGAGVEYKPRGKSDGKPPREPKPGSYQSHVQKQRSLDHSEGRRPPPPVQKYRHYSGEDYYSNGYGSGGGGGGYGGYNNYENGMSGGMHPQYGSPPAVMRDPSYPFRMMNDGYNIYNGEPYGYYGNGPVYGGRGRGGRRGERHGGRDRKDDIRPAPPVQEDFNKEFPSLNGEYNDGLRKGRANSTGAWDHRSGVHALATKKDKSGGQKDRREELYKALIPAKVKIARRGQDNNIPLANAPALMNGSPAAKPSNPPPQARDKKEVSTPIQILSSVKTAPKKLGNKTKFLRTLKEGEKKVSSGTDNGTAGKADTVTSSKANRGGGGKGEENGQSHAINGVVRENGVGVPHAVNGLHEEDEEFLSRSLEEEQRLLKEMGWHESDTEDYEITEDEKREFFAKQKVSPRQTNGHAAAPPRAPEQQQQQRDESICDTDDGSDDASSDSDLQAS